MVNPDKWLIDNTALTNFALIDQLGLLSEYLRDKLVITQEVKDEFFVNLMPLNYKPDSEDYYSFLNSFFLPKANIPPSPKKRSSRVDGSGEGIE